MCRGLRSAGRAESHPPPGPPRIGLCPRRRCRSRGCQASALAATCRLTSVLTVPNAVGIQSRGAGLRRRIRDIPPGSPLQASTGTRAHSPFILDCTTDSILEMKTGQQAMEEKLGVASSFLVPCPGGELERLRVVFYRCGQRSSAARHPRAGHTDVRPMSPTPAKAAGPPPRDIMERGLFNTPLGPGRPEPPHSIEHTRPRTPTTRSGRERAPEGSRERSDRARRRSRQPDGSGGSFLSTRAAGR
jgi:hypothetical protein